MKVPPLPQAIRLDKYLIERYPFTSRKYWREHLALQVKVNGKRPVKGHLLSGGEDLLLDPEPTATPAKVSPNPNLDLSLIYEDDFLFVLNKPAGLPCQPANDQDTNNVVSAIVARFPEQQSLDPAAREGGLTHRLDNGTSGILLVAKNETVKNRLRESHHQGKISKEYQAWVHGQVTQGGIIKDPIAHHPKNTAKMIVPDSDKDALKWKARPALTQYEVLKSGESYSLLRAAISKGMRHQIRIHLARQGHPIVGDVLYGSPVVLNAGRHLLHAHRLDFLHPISEKRICLEAPLPQDFKP